MRALALALVLIGGCSYIARFEPRDRPDADADADIDAPADADADADRDEGRDADIDIDEGADLDTDQGDDDIDVEMDRDDAEPDSDCEPRCGERTCGPDGCGGECPPGCEERETCTGPGACIPTWVRIEPGVFQMGSPVGEVGRTTDPGGDETMHEVSLSHAFLILSTEVTQAFYFQVMGENPAHFTEALIGVPVDDHPAENLSWHDAAYFCNQLSTDTGLPQCYRCSVSGGRRDCGLSAGSSPYDCTGYRLPTEAEWEYSARAGTTSATYLGELSEFRPLFPCETPQPHLDPIAWWACNSDNETRAVGGLGPNAWGLYDMLGNVREWVHDWYDVYPDTSPSTPDPFGPVTGAARVARGGSGGLGPNRARAAYRFEEGGATYHDGFLGFRVVRTL